MFRTISGALLITFSAHAQINSTSITIARDSFGIPHIYGSTDAEVAYGLAWAHSEDDFENIQYNLLAGKGMLGEVIGKEGVLFDFGLKFLRIDSLVEARYEKDISSDYKRVLEGYAQGINDFAASHPKEVVLKKAFPIRPKDMVKGYTLQTSLMAGLGMALKAMRDDKVQEYYAPNDVGSNSMAIAPARTTDGAAYLLINSHQPIEGRFAWYEAHLQSEEGWNIIGGLFPGGASVFVGTNEHLGWAHTTNYHNFGDIYRLEVNPKNKSQYKYDGMWRDFAKRTIRLKVKLGFIKLGVTRTVLETEYGPVFKTKNAWYAIRFPAYTDIRAAEQWYRMDKARSLDEFEKAMRMDALPLFNVVYADREGNIYFHSGGQIPRRNPSLDWRQPIAANSSAYKWNDLLKYDEKPTVLNPECGFIYNCNQTPLFSTGDECEWQGYFTGLQQFVYNRGERFREMLEGHEGKFSWEDFLWIKFDKAYNDTGTYAKNFAALYTLDESKYPDIADAIRKLKNWNREGTADNTDAALALVTHDFLRKKCDCPFALLMIRKRAITEEEAVEAIREAKKFMLKTHSTLDVSLGEVQRHIRGSVSLPAGGLREVPRAADGKLFDKKKGIFRVESGDGYIQAVKFYKDKIELSAINAYGASAHPGSPHYNDQMQIFEKEKFRMMTFDKADILKKSERVYHPGE